MCQKSKMLLQRSLSEKIIPFACFIYYEANWKGKHFKPLPHGVRKYMSMQRFFLSFLFCRIQKLLRKRIFLRNRYRMAPSRFSLSRNKAFVCVQPWEREREREMTFPLLMNASSDPRGNQRMARLHCTIWLKTFPPYNNFFRVIPELDLIGVIISGFIADPHFLSFQDENTNLVLRV